MACATIATYVLIGINIFATHTLGLTPAQAFGGVIIAGLMGVIFNPVGGWLSDRVGRKPMMIGAYGLLCVIGLPCFMVMASSALAGSALCDGCGDGDVTGLRPAIHHGPDLVESLPPGMRSGAIGIIYAVAISIFGGYDELDGHLADGKAPDRRWRPPGTCAGRWRWACFRHADVARDGAGQDGVA